MIRLNEPRPAQHCTFYTRNTRYITSCSLTNRSARAGDYITTHARHAHGLKRLKKVKETRDPSRPKPGLRLIRSSKKRRAGHLRLDVTVLDS